MPRLNCQVGVEDSVHLGSDIGDDLDDRCQVKNPTEEIQRPCEEAENTPIFRTRGDRSPMVDASC